MRHLTSEFFTDKQVDGFIAITLEQVEKIFSSVSYKNKGNVLFTYGDNVVLLKNINISDYTSVTHFVKTTKKA